MSSEEAAAVCDGLMMAKTFMRKIDFQESKRILINGASGSIGSACVQLAGYYGARITAVCGPDNIELVKSLGAERVIDFTQEDFTKDGQVYDIVIDAVGKSSYFRCRRLIRPGGVYFSTDLGFLAQNIVLALWTPVFGRKKVKFPLPKVGPKDIEFFKELIESGKYRAVIDRCYPLEQIVEATRYVETGQKTGNVVITLR
jgi:NADPH:quinone reductase-like Zn-dependent oxidoreductase